MRGIRIERWGELRLHPFCVRCGFQRGMIIGCGDCQQRQQSRREGGRCAFEGFQDNFGQRGVRVDFALKSKICREVIVDAE